jgi:hypothetical protein
LVIIIIRNCSLFGHKEVWMSVTFPAARYHHNALFRTGVTSLALQVYRSIVIL